ncbi:MAG: hypothetical protein NWE91_00265 [Candidatus Bathyarchaeota archaeon]|nr:hypothetical protein [Candidatus Bathyarchaeota archaeon]
MSDLNEKIKTLASLIAEKPLEQRKTLIEKLCQELCFHTDKDGSVKSYWSIQNKIVLCAQRSNFSW